MSHPSHGNINIIDAGKGPGTGDHQYPPHSAPTLAPQEISNFVDGSGPIFSMYMEMATEEDKKLVENWKADADGILIFTGLFSAAVASLISVSIQDIRPNPQDTSNFYLANIYQTISDPNPPNNSSPLPASPPPFSPPNYAVWVNGLWFLSLVISVSCALLATLLQQWARRYLKITQPRYSPHKRARIRAFFAEGVDKFLLPWAVEALPTLLHVSLFLFFSGLVVFLCNVNLTIFKVVLSWVGVCVALYGCITFLPIFRHDSPYYTPLSLPAWHIVTGLSFIICWVMLLPTFHYFGEVFARFWELKDRYRKLLRHGMLKTAEETALNSPSEIDTRVFMWTLDSLDEDHELERFFSGLPGFRNSKVVDDPLPSLTLHQKQRLSMALIELLNLTFSSDLLPEHVKNRRAIICEKAIDSTEIPCAYWHIVDRILSEDQYWGLQTAEFGRITRRWGNSVNQGALLVQAINTGIVARARLRDDPWFILTSNELGVSETVLRYYATHGDNLSLAILIHIIRHHFDHIQKWLLPGPTLSKIIKAAAQLDVQDTSLELRLQFCALWNEVVLRAQNNNSEHIAWNILRCIRHVYVALHQGTDSAPTGFAPSTKDHARILEMPSTYPLCNVPGHHPGSTPRPHEVSTSPRVVWHRALSSAPFHLSPPRSKAAYMAPLAPLPEMLPPKKIKPLPVPPQPTYRTINSRPIPATSPDSPTQDGVDVTAPISTPELLVPSWTALDVPDTPSSPPTAIPDNTLPTDPSSGATTKGEGSVHVDSGNDKGPLDPSAIREDFMASSGVSSQSPSPPSVSGVAVAGPSLGSYHAEHTGDPPHPLHGQYDFV